MLEDGSSLSDYVHYPDKKFTFDIMATDDQGNKFEMRDYPIADGKEGQVQLTQSDLNDTAPDFKLATLDVQNNTGKEIDYLFISPSDSDAWGVDMLDAESTLSDGDTHSVVIPIGKDKVTYNLMAADENNDEYVFDVKLDPKKGTSFSVSIESSDLKPNDAKQ